MNILKDKAFFSYQMDEQNSGVEGLMCIEQDLERAKNYLQAQGYNGEFHIFDETPTAILKNIWVEEELRGEGHGSHLLELFINEARTRGMERVLLIADTGETNEFDLVSWYEDNGFIKVNLSEENPLMTYDLR